MRLGRLVDQDKLAERKLDAVPARLPVTAAYCDYLQSLRTQPYAVLAMAFFAIEYVYNRVRGAWHRQCMARMVLHTCSHDRNLPRIDRRGQAWWAATSSTRSLPSAGAAVTSPPMSTFCGPRPIVLCRPPRRRVLLQPASTTVRWPRSPTAVRGGFQHIFRFAFAQAERRAAEEVAGVKIPRLEVQFWQMALK
jgi:hypothetical protein